MGSTAEKQLVFLFLLVAATATATATVSPFCTNSTDFPDDQAICTWLVNGAQTWAEAMTNTIKGVIGIANMARPGVLDGLEAKLPRELDAVSKDGIGSVCREYFDNYISYLEQCIELVKDDPYHSSLKTYLSQPMFTFCNVALEDFNLSLPEVTQFKARTNKLAGILLSVLDKRPPEN